MDREQAAGTWARLQCPRFRHSQEDEASGEVKQVGYDFCTDGP